MAKFLKHIRIASYCLVAIKMIRRIIRKCKSKQSFVEKCQAADTKVSIEYREAMRDALSKRKEAWERMAATITATQLKMPGGSEEMWAVLGGGANIQYDHSEILGCCARVTTPNGH